MTDRGVAANRSRKRACCTGIFAALLWRFKSQRAEKNVARAHALPSSTRWRRSLGRRSSFVPSRVAACGRPRGTSERLDTLDNGALLKVPGCELLLTTDRSIRYPQNLRVRRIALVVLTGTTKWSLVRQRAARIAAAVASATAGSYAEVVIPSEPK